MTTAQIQGIQGVQQQWSMVVVYDPKTGHIAHTHQVLTRQGGLHPDPAALEKLALEHGARARNASLDGHALLHVDPATLDSDAGYAVDLKTRTLRKIALPR